MKIIQYPEKQEWDSLLSRPDQDQEEIRNSVSQILEDVKKNGDVALQKYTKALDGVQLDNIKVSDEEMDAAAGKLDDALKEAIRMAAANIEKFHAAQKGEETSVEVIPGLNCWQKPVPIDSIGIYVPGGSAPLFSSVLMMALPARVAGCNNIILTTPPDKEGGVHPAILYAARQSGVNKIYKVGGAQAVAAMAYGTESILRVNKIFGPGNRFVTLAKQLVSMEGVAIDLPAGPSEVLVVADDQAPPRFIAADLLSQAEHGTDSQVLLLSASERLLEDTRREIENMLKELPRKDIAEKALEYSRLILLSNMDEIMDMVNCYAPEHLILATENATELSRQVRNSGSVFIGNYTPESLGDYTSGTNHVLPTNGYAVSHSGVNLDAFVKKITFQRASQDGLGNIGESTMTMARAEGLEAHSMAVQVRMENKSG
ncbi:MAG: histidinol dehydrogenase [Bacteroidales bacterium]|nr:histidinol dehydrogenase [Bacteroidales bacterium]